MLAHLGQRRAGTRPAPTRRVIFSLLVGGSLGVLAAAPAYAQALPQGEGRDASEAQSQVQAANEDQVVCPAPQGPAVPEPPADANLPAVPPIICEDEMAREAPAIGAETDPELEQPLESVAEFEQRLAGQPAGADPELSQPLPPLEQFDVREVELAQPETAVEAVELRYAVKVEGLAAADALTDVALNNQFDSLSALRNGKGKAANEAMLSARLEEDSKLLQRMLHAEGWYDARVDTRIDRGAATDGQPVAAVLVAAPGNRYVLGAIDVAAGTTVPADLISKNFALKAGDPIVADRIQGAEANIAVVLPQEGYPFAEIGQRDVLLGELDGTPFYIGGQQFEVWQHTQLLIDVVPGCGSGFSLEAPLGVRFLTRSRVFDPGEQAWLDACGTQRGSGAAGQ